MAHNLSSNTSDLAARLLTDSHDELGDEERRVLENIAAGRLTSRDADEVATERATFGERLADRVAAVGGSWHFIIAFTAVLLGWMVINTDILQHFGIAFDPYPYIFLNLMLSTLAAVQAPIIMMSQNRQASKDRIAAQLDYETNLRAELEILRLHEKVDLLVCQRLDRIEARLDHLPQTVEKPAKPD
ncbi:DUF1003 domain-containing protein [Sphingomonas jaspsi]|jgi:uncharacterized membrane protein|uniref:DUF1003 domain-containing protein n=1 Tax=Sphingomonas jaspsi TaxID=392409 RepID=UPI0004B10AC9|nr:DUF1003 domain-containing protein [Sphingomonas jaspsi]